MDPGDLNRFSPAEVWSLLLPRRHLLSPQVPPHPGSSVVAVNTRGDLGVNFDLCDLSITCSVSAAELHTHPTGPALQEAPPSEQTVRSHVSALRVDHVTFHPLAPPHSPELATR